MVSPKVRVYSLINGHSGQVTWGCRKDLGFEALRLASCRNIWDRADSSFSRELLLNLPDADRQVMFASSSVVAVSQFHITARPEALTFRSLVLTGTTGDSSSRGPSPCQSFYDVDHLHER